DTRCGIAKVLSPVRRAPTACASKLVQGAESGAVGARPAGDTRCGTAKVLSPVRRDPTARDQERRGWYPPSFVEPGGDPHQGGVPVDGNLVQRIGANVVAPA